MRRLAIAARPTATTATAFAMARVLSSAGAPHAASWSVPLTVAGAVATAALTSCVIAAKAPKEATIFDQSMLGTRPAGGLQPSVS